MAITQISRITHRKGTNENLPQLAVGEFGWSTDTRQLYMGNGGNDAPSIENVEILTENSTVGVTSYTYADSVIGYTAVTGTDATVPTVRTIQAKLDDTVSVRDYGATGDGATDDTAAINRALTDLFVSQTFQATRRTLLVPAGTYIIDASALKIPAHATIVGEGTKSSVFKRATTSITNVAQTADSLNQIGVNIGTGGAAVPSNITIRNMVFEAGADIDGFLVDQTSNMYFDNCTFIGNKTSLPTVVGTGKACLRVASNGSNISSNITFNSCVFQNHTYGVQIDDVVNNVVFNDCRFQTLFKGIVVGFEDSSTSPKSVKSIGSYFDNIYDRGIHVYDGTFASAFNHFGEVGTNGAGAGSPVVPVIEFVDGQCHAVGDIFDRTDSDDATQPRIEAGNLASYTVDPSVVRFGRFQREIGSQITLTDNTAVAATTGLTFSDTLEKYVEIEYSIIRGTTVRNGIARITHDASNQNLAEEYDENNGSVGVTFTLTNASNVTTLNYTTTSTGTNATLKYSIRKIV